MDTDEAVILFTKKKIHFAPRTILTHEMLEAINDFPREILRLQYLNFGDGIISGLEFKEVGNEIFLTEGLVKLKGEFYLSAAGEINLTKFFKDNKSPSHGIISCFALCPSQNFKVNGGVKRESLELKILAKKDLPPDALCLGNFSDELFEVVLPDKNIPAEKFLGEFMTLNRLQLLEIPYSCYGGATFHPYIFSAVKNILKQKENKSPAELALLMQIEQSGFVTLETLKTYIETDNAKKIPSTATREEIFKGLSQVLKFIHAKMIYDKEKSEIKKAHSISLPNLRI